MFIIYNVNIILLFNIKEIYSLLYTKIIRKMKYIQQTNIK